MTGKKKEFYTVNFRLTLPVARKLKKAAKASGMGIAGFMRYLIQVHS